MASLFTSPKFQAFDSAGNPLSAGKVYTYVGGTVSTPKATYTTQSGGVTNANPVVLDASGCADIWLGAGAYKFTVTDSAGAAAPFGTVDNIQGIEDASAINFTQSGANAVTTTLQTKAREWISPGDFGATGDNSTDDTTTFQYGLNQLAVAIPKATGYKITAASIAAGSFVAGKGRANPININGTGGVAVAGSNSTLAGLYLNGPASAQLIYASATAANVRLESVEFASDATSSPNGHAVQTAQAGCDNWSLLNSIANVYDFGFLQQNSAAADGPKGLLLANNVITTQVGDCVEINTPGSGATANTAAMYGRIIGNRLKVAAGSGTAAGFGIGLAHVNAWALVGNVSERSWLEARHVEDGSRNVSVVADIALNCLSDGFRHIINGPGNNDSQTRTVSVVGSHYESATIVTNAAGIRVVFNANGTPWGDTIVGNSVRNFDVGLWLGGNGTHFADGNVIDACNVAMRVDLGNDTDTRVEGTNLVRGTAAALLDVNNSVGAMLSVGKFVCDTKPTAIVTRSGGSTTRPGVEVRGFSWPQTQVLTAGATTWVTLFPAAATCRFGGLFKARAKNNAAIVDNASCWATVDWDGTTLTIANAKSEVNGGLALNAPPFLRVNGGNFQIGLFDAAAITVRIDIDLEGFYYL